MTHKRIFTFGCSFTEYLWPTWADLIAYDRKPAEFWNYGTSGSSNPHICAQIVQADIRHKFTQDDLVMVMWTAPARQDVYEQNIWRCNGNIYNIYNPDVPETHYAKEFSKLPPEHYVIRDLVQIKLAQQALRSSDAECVFMKMTDLLLGEHHHVDQHDLINTKFPGIADQDLPDFVSAIMRSRKSDHVHEKFQDGHPDIWDHYKYLEICGLIASPGTYQLAKALNQDLMKFMDSLPDVSHDKKIEMISDNHNGKYPDSGENENLR